MTSDGLLCRWCRSEIKDYPEESSNFIISEGSCKTCSNWIFRLNNRNMVRESVEMIDAPILVLQPEPRLVFTANKKACELFEKKR